MTTTIDATRALELLKEAVAERGKNFIYTATNDTKKCTYQKNGKPDCGVGLVLHKAGVPVNELESLDAQHVVARHLSEMDLPVRVSQGAAYLLQVFQREQDIKVPWGQALEIAASVYGQALLEDRTEEGPK